MKKQPHSWHNYIPLLIAVITVLGTIIGGVLTIISNTKPIERDIAWLKENTSGMKDEITKLKHSIEKTDNISSDNFGEILAMLEKMESKDKGKRGHRD